MIDKRRLFDHVASLIRDPLASGRLTHGWHEEMDRHFFYLSSPHNDEQALSWLPFLHACWHQHRHEKSTIWEKETTVQTALAPKFLQLEAFSPGYTSFKWAEKLGGTAFEEFAYRHDFEAEDDHRWFGSPAAEANRWFVTLMRLDSPRGQRFRAAYQEEILRIAELGLRELPGIANKVPDALQFLFLDKDRSNAAPLAVQFWPTVDAIADEMNHGSSEFALDLRLDYLSRLWPLSTTEMFVEAIMKVPVDEWIDPQKLNRLDDSVRFEILTAAIEALQEEQKKYRKPKYARNDPYSRIEANITRLNTRRMHLPTKPAAELFVEHWESKSDFYMPQLRKQMAVDSIHDDHVELLAKHEAPRLRSIALSAIRSHPNVRRLIVLDMLRSDPDDAVRIEAAQVDSDLKRLRKSAPPRYSTESLK